MTIVHTNIKMLNIPQIYMSLHSDTLSSFQVFALFPEFCVFSAETVNTNLSIVNMCSGKNRSNRYQNDLYNIKKQVH